MRLHTFHLTPHGLIRAYCHIIAGSRLCRKAGLSLRRFIPDSVNSMTAAWNVYETFEQNSLKRPQTIIDVGANVSQMTRLLLATAPDAAVISFEPNQKLSPIGDVRRIALSDVDGETEFYIPHDDTDWGTIESDKINVSAKTIRYVVPTRRMDSLIDAGELQLKKVPVLVKIDTEGSEQKVLLGIGKHLRDIDYLLVEVENQENRGMNYNLISMCIYLNEYGFNSSKIVYACYDGPTAPAYCDVLFWKGDKS